VINQAAILEKQCLAATPLLSAATKLRRALTRLYIHILPYRSNVKSFPEEESKFKRIIKSTLAIEEFVDGALADISNRRLDTDISAVTCLAEQQSHAPEDEANFFKYVRYGIVSRSIDIRAYARIGDIDVIREEIQNSWFDEAEIEEAGFVLRY